VTNPTTFTAFTRAEIDAIAVGKTRIANRWSAEATEVVSIHAKGEDIHGKLYVCGYVRFGTNGGKVSFSIKEGDELDASLYRIEQS
jgi:hypothetical protein